MSFENLNLHESLLSAVRDAGYTEATEVQQRAIPPALEGRDLMVSSSTGSGKTASFVLPALTRVLAARNDPEKRRDKGQAHGPRVLVLVPTRELAIQVSKAAMIYGRHVRGLRVSTVVGGVPYGLQLRQLSGPLDILIATPGRLMDHMQSGKAVLANVETLVLDEADRMLDMGFIDDIHFIAQHLPKERQTVMFSATFGGHVGRLAEELLKNPQRVDVSSHTDTHADIEQRLHWADDLQHKNALLDRILTDKAVDQALVFTSTQRDADWLADRLADMGHAVASLHGGMPQGRRNRVLQGLRSHQLRVLVATDVAARGIDVPTISHVINYGLPMKAEDYVHRIGRTGRAGRSGLAVTLAERRDAGMVQRIQRFTTQRIPAAVIEGLEPKRAEPSEMPRGPNKGFKGAGFKGPRGGQGGFAHEPRQSFGHRGGPGHASAGGGHARFENARADRAPADVSPFSKPSASKPAFSKPGYPRPSQGGPGAAGPVHSKPGFGHPERAHGGAGKPERSREGFDRKPAGPRSAAGGPARKPYGPRPTR